MTAWLKAGNTAAVTGGGNGIGRAAAERFVQAGMNVVIADLNAEALSAAEAHLKAMPGGADRVLAHVCDVSKPADVEALRDAAANRFGPVHCLMNNAGISRRIQTPWDDLETMRLLMEVNLWGVINGCCAFIPAMLEHGDAAAVINTGSKQGITRPPGNAAYNMSKAGVLTYTEAVAHAFRNLEGCQIQAHLLVPGFVYSNMIASFLPEKPAGAFTSEETIDFMLSALAAGDFYIICPDNETDRATDEKRMQWTADDVIKNRPALSRWHPDYEDAFAAFMKGSND